MKRSYSLAVLVLAALAPLAGAAELERPESVKFERSIRNLPLCIDAVVVARVTRFRDKPARGEPWELDLAVEHVYLGDIRPGELTISTSVQAPYRTDAWLVLMLTRQPKSWHVADKAYAVRDKVGRFVIPIFEPARDNELSPKGWMPRDYDKWLRPIHYPAAQEVPGTSHWKEGPRFADDEWARVSRYRVTVKRGYRLADVPGMLEERRALECRRQ